MEVVLLKDVPSLGKAGSKVTVKDGYAANLLLPQGLAALPSSLKAQQYLKDAQKRTEERVAENEKRNKMAKQFDGQVVELPVKVGAQGKLFGSVTAAQVAEIMKIDKRYIVMPKSIRTIGTYPLVLSFGDGIKATLVLKIVQLEKTS